MTEHLRQTVRSFLRSERPVDRGEAEMLVKDWFGRYDPDPKILDEEITRHFAPQPSGDTRSPETHGTV